MYTLYSSFDARPKPTGLPEPDPGAPPTSRPTKSWKSNPTADSFFACSFAWSMHWIQTVPSFSVLLSCLARMTLNASTSSLAHFTHALIMGGGKQLWKHKTVL